MLFAKRTITLLLIILASCQLTYSQVVLLGDNTPHDNVNDGTYMLYSLIDWEATLFTSKNMFDP